MRYSLSIILDISILNCEGSTADENVLHGTAVTHNIRCTPHVRSGIYKDMGTRAGLMWFETMSDGKKFLEQPRYCRLLMGGHRLCS